MLQTATQLNFPQPAQCSTAHSQSIFQLPVKFHRSGPGAVYSPCATYSNEEFDTAGRTGSVYADEEFEGSGRAGTNGGYPVDEEFDSSGQSGGTRAYSDEEFEGSEHSSSTTGGSSEAEETSVHEEDWTEYFCHEEKGMETFNGTVGGHSTIYTIEGESKIMKPANPSEKKVYEKLKKVTAIGDYIPKYYGTTHYEERNVKVRRFQKVGEFIVLENLTKPFNRPCVMDLKMGSRTYRDEMTTIDIARRKVKSSATTARTSGFKISGLRVSNISLLYIFS
jgi:hypothetical protein